MLAQRLTFLRPKKGRNKRENRAMAELDQAKVDAFTQAMTGLLNGGTLALMTSIGHQTGLFETLATLPPSTSRQIADVAGLNERYVREWLNTMATGKIVTYAPENGTYALPAEHAAVLTKAAGPGNMAAFARIIPILSKVEPGIVDSFPSRRRGVLRPIPGLHGALGGGQRAEIRAHARDQGHAADARGDDSLAGRHCRARHRVR